MLKNEPHKKTPMEMAIENNPCQRCRLRGYLTCQGHGESGSASGAGDNSANDKVKAQASLSKPNPVSSDQTVNPSPSHSDKAKEVWIQSQLLSDKTLHYKAGLLIIESDRLRGNLTFQIKPGLSAEEIKTSQAFLKAVKAAFAEFTNADQNIAAQKFSVDLKADRLIIHISHPTYYTAFLKHLESKNLLPLPNLEQQAQQTNTSTPCQKLPSPFDSILKGPRPSKL